MPREKARSDALVFFGATGDLAYKKIFPALQAMAKKGRLDFPVVGVAKSGWNLDQLVERAKASVTECGGGADPEAFPQLARRLRYVDGDYADPDTFARLRGELGRAERPAHYLAIPPSMFPTVVRQLQHGRLHEGRPGHRREAVRPRPRVRARAEPHAARSAAGGVHLPDRPFPRQGGRPEHPVLPLRERLPGARLQSQLRRERADHDGGELRGERTRQVLRGDRSDPRRDPEPPASGGELPRDGGAFWDLRRGDPRRAGEGAAHDSPDERREHGARAVPGLPRRAGSREGLRGRHVRRAAPLRRLLALGGRAVLRPGRQVPEDDLHRGDRRAAPGAPRCVLRGDAVHGQLRAFPLEPARS